MGISEAFIVIYGPVWVNNYSPKEHSAKWMGILHSVTALGVMFGYVFAGIIINFFSDFVSWRFAIQIQGFAQIPVALFFFFEKEEYINVDLSKKDRKLDINLNLNTISEVSESVNQRTPDPSSVNVSKFDICNNMDLGKEMRKINSKQFRYNGNESGINNKQNSPKDFIPNVITDNKYSEMIINENSINQNINAFNTAYLSNNNIDQKMQNDHPQTFKFTNNMSANGNLNIHNINNNNNNLQTYKSKGSFGNNQKSNNISISKGRKDARMDVVETSNLKNYCNQVYEVMSNPLYITTTMALCSIYFIVTGIQFWMTNYLIDILGNDPILVIVIFSIVSITAPLGGVIVGGTFADAYGGYRGKNTLKAIKLCSAFGVIAFIFAFPIGFLYSLIYITVLLWTFLFFGAAIVPVSTGIMVSSVRRYK